MFKVELISSDTSCDCLEHMYDYIADCCSVVRNKQPRDSEKLFKRLMKESYGDKPSRVLELIPCEMEVSELNQLPKPIKYFGFTIDNIYYTNMRELLNLGFELDIAMGYISDFRDYATFRITAPYFIYAQVSTHTQLTTVSHSKRYSKDRLGYWKPEEIDMSQDEWNDFVYNTSPYYLRDSMKNVGITRGEILNRGADSLELRSFVIGGYTNDPSAWKHFINQRLDSHTQKETRELAKQIDKFLWN